MLINAAGEAIVVSEGTVTRTKGQSGTPAALSYVAGETAPPLLDLTIGDCLANSAARWPTRTAIVSRHEDARLSFAELAAQAEKYAQGFLALGLEPGDRVGIWSPNCVDWVITQYATALAGLILVNINPAYRQSELEFALNKVGCKALVTAPRFKSSDYIGILRALMPESMTSKPGRLESRTIPALRWLIVLGPERQPGFLNFADLPAQADARARARLATVRAGLRPADAINIQFTSGTTGRPKGATLTHHNLVNNAYFCGLRLGFTEADSLCLPVPLYHCFGMVLGSLLCLIFGAKIVYPSDAFDPVATLEAIEAERCTAFYGVPTMFIAALEEARRRTYVLTSLRSGLSGGAPCPEEIMKRVMTELNMKDVSIAFGMTETSPCSFQTETDDPVHLRVTTVGRVFPHTEAKIVDAEGNIVPRGTPGEVLVRGYCVMKGYWDDDARTREAIDADGWMHTGDLCVIGDDGYCRVVGRIKDMIIRGGENIYPREVEELLYQHPAIEDVHVFGIPDPKFGEEVCAWIKLRAGHAPSADDIIAFCKDRISYYKIPKHIRFVSEFPMTATNKVQKFAMREAMIAALARA